MASVATAALRAAKAALRGELKKRIASIPHEEQYRQSKLVTEKDSKVVEQQLIFYLLKPFFLKATSGLILQSLRKVNYALNDELLLCFHIKVLANDRFKGSHRVSIYLSINEEIRVQTVGILEQLLEQNKECFVPKFTPNSHDMAMLKIYSLEDYAKLVADNWEILPPTEEDMKREDAYTTGGLDLMIVPGLAFTKRGHRLGGGKGYYDVYVQNCSHDPSGRPYTIGLAFKEQILHSIPVDVHDFMVDEVTYPDN